MKRFIIFSLSALFILGGCSKVNEKQNISEMRPDELPDKIAFQDEFTREFMASTEEVEDGYYLFESKTGGYTMLYPENANLDKMYYERGKDHFEALHFGESEETAENSYYVRATYDQGGIAEDPERGLYLLSTSIKYDGEYEKFDHDNKTIYFATAEKLTKENKPSVYRFFGLIKSNESDQSLRYKFNVTCFNDDKECSPDLEAIEEEVKMIMKSVEFKPSES